MLFGPIYMQVVVTLNEVCLAFQCIHLKKKNQADFPYFSLVMGIFLSGSR